MLLGFLGCLGALKEVKVMLGLVSWGAGGEPGRVTKLGGGGWLCRNFLGQPRGHVVPPHPVPGEQQRGAGRPLRAAPGAGEGLGGRSG